MTAVLRLVASQPSAPPLLDRLEVAARRARLLRVLTDALILRNDVGVPPEARERLAEVVVQLEAVEL